MWRRCGVVLIAVALVAMPSVPVLTSCVGGSAVAGHVEGGRYFVNPQHGQPVAEMSESTWLTVYWVERVWPWSAFVPGFVGLLLATNGKGAAWKPPAQPPQWVLVACGVAAVLTVAAVWVCWAVTHPPWVVMLVAWVLFLASGATVGWLYWRALRRQPPGEPECEPAQPTSTG